MEEEACVDEVEEEEDDDKVEERGGGGVQRGDGARGRRSAALHAGDGLRRRGGDVSAE